MNKYSTAELRELEVINLCGGTRLGYPSDFEFDACDGKVSALIIGGGGGFFGIGGKEDIIIPWQRIECIGEDAILVKIPENEIENYCLAKKKRSPFSHGKDER